MKIEMSPGRKLAFASLFCALAMVSTAVFKLVPMGSFSFVRFSLTPSIIMFSSLFLGPWYGAAIGALSDLIPALFVPTGLMEINPLITVVYFFMGMLPYFIMKALEKWEFLSSPWVFVILIVLTLGGLLPYLIFSGSLENFFGDASGWAIPTMLTIVTLALVGYLVYFLVSYRKKGHAFERRVATMSYVIELLVGCFMKAGAFSIFYCWLSSSPFPLPYEFVLSMLCLALPINASVSFFFVNVYCKVSSKTGLFSLEENPHGRE